MRNYKRQTIKKYKEEDIELALENVTNDKMSLNTASKIYKIPRGTLQNRYNGRFLIKKHGGQTVLSENEEKQLSTKISLCASWGFPLDKMDIRLIVKSYLCENGKDIKQFKENIPGVDWVDGFLKRHSKTLSQRTSNNIKSVRASVDSKQLKDYHLHLCEAIGSLEPHQIFNYDETNLADNPSSKKFIFSRGVKYPDNVANFTKSCVTLMFCVAADGTLLPPHIVFKAGRIYEKWIENGPKGSPCCIKTCCKGGCQFSCTASGWFDQETFEKWFEYSFLPHAKKIEGSKALIGDNLSSHFSSRVIDLAEKNNILFLSLPPNSTHLSQPLDVSFFGPMKKAWSKILFKFKCHNPKTSSVNKIIFASILKELLSSEPFKTNIPQNIRSGFAATGIYPLEVEPLLKRLTGNKSTVLASESAQGLDDSITCYLRKNRFSANGKGPPSKRGKMINVVAGRPITSLTFCNNVSKATTSKRKRPIEDLTDSDSSNYDSDMENTQVDNISISSSQPTPVQKYSKGDFVVMEMKGKKTTKRFLAQIISDFRGEEDELEVQFFIKVGGNERNKCFRLSDEASSFIDKSSIVEPKLQVPILDNRGLYTFQNEVPL